MLPGLTSREYRSPSARRASADDSRAAHGHELREIPFESRGRDDLQESGRLIAGVPERVPLVSWFENEVAGSSLYYVLPEQRTDASREDIAVFVFALMPMARGAQGAR